ncbi:MAG: HAMP domain-containing histidine kinase [Planctomycetota bacterium]|nr:MAG: HAMP domain-containing histidine kinase [Planctomycetota bacterium]
MREAWESRLRRVEPPFEPDLVLPEVDEPAELLNVAAAAPTELTGAAVLLDEVERALLAGEPPEALEERASSARASATSDHERARALRLQVSLALRASDPERARNRLNELILGASEAAQSETSLALLAWLEVAGAGHSAGSALIAERVGDGTLALPLSSVDLALDGPRPRWVGDERMQALLAQVRGVSGAEALVESLERALARRQVFAFVKRLGALSPTAGGERWQLVPRGECIRAQRFDPSPATVLARNERVLDAVRAAAPSLPSGFAWEFAKPQAIEASPRVRETSLTGPYNAYLRTPDVDDLAHGAVQRVMLLKSALLALAALCLLGGWATWRAMVRERRLAELRALFVANVSHELRTPLASILLLAENLADGRVKNAEQAARYHTGIQREALRLRELVDSVLDLSRLERGKPLAIDRADVPLEAWWAATAAELVERALSRGAAMEIRTGELGGRAQLDGNALRRALLNLVENALRHSGDTRLEADAGIVGGELVLGVRDHGRGIPEAERERVFEPFERLEVAPAASSTATPGTGLGLSIVRAIAVAHGGRATCVPVDSGARFELAIPIQAPEVAAT